ncbi:hypothetical protein P7C71_g4123, partial [Lecanoromycetidae sp. Uapishka_2]
MLELHRNRQKLTANLTTDSATTLTITGSSAKQTRAVPIWHCTSGCENNDYGIIVTPPIAEGTGAVGNVFPPSGYPTSLSSSYPSSSTHPSSSTLRSSSLGSITHTPLITATPTTSVTVTSSGNNASQLQVWIIYAQRAISSYIQDPTDTKLQQKAEDDIERAKNYGTELLDEHGGPDPDTSECHSSGGLLGDLVEAATCAVEGLKTVDDDVKGGEDDLDKLEYTDFPLLIAVIEPLVPGEPVPTPPTKDPPDNGGDDGHEDSTTELKTTEPTTTATSSATAARTPYIIFAYPTADMSSLSSVFNTKVPVPSETSFLEATGVIAFWGIPSAGADAATAGLTPSEAEELQKQPGVSTIIVNAPMTVDADPDDADATTSAPDPEYTTVIAEADGASTEGPTATGTTRRRDLADEADDVLSSHGGDAIAHRHSQKDSTDHYDPTLSKRDNSVAIAVQERQKNPNTRRYYKNGEDVPYELRAISQPNKRPLPTFAELDYAYRVEAGQGTWAYVIDSGINKFHDEFQHGCTIVPDDEWIIVVPATNARNDPNGHGTGVASKICGRISGVTKKATLIPVKINIRDLLGYASCFTQVLNDIKQRREDGRGAEAGKTVVNFSNDYGNEDPPYMIDRAKPVMQAIMNLDVPITIGAGNGRIERGPAINTAPAMWASAAFPLIVVSSTGRDFFPAASTQFDEHTTVWAIGVNNVGAISNGNLDIAIDLSGTSFGMFPFLAKFVNTL